MGLLVQIDFAWCETPARIDTRRPGLALVFHSGTGSQIKNILLQPASARFPFEVNPHNHISSSPARYRKPQAGSVA